ncbi:MAG: tetratricopeptide repeat protein, partial [Acidobacteria bacterium]|nr:tetratricopeptide repeat protein [Acidobacteriota bacterium]NIM63790.1 tetratricopeptide repeat protein [Acidobacteriota bacterium]NIO58453.1 tetratricopeptide repeat protein [Acidobacteriota bacterium]NIQ29516.1 tetratricopeptide repeat protein [Acidobacteriota bacterium]NIQ84198.1 tetratricopeptide repeat protein [Acidobacteriota bacterium]
MSNGPTHRHLPATDRVLACLALVLFLFSSLAIAQEDGVIRLGPREPVEPSAEPITGEKPLVQDGDNRRGFNYERFETRLESLWFQRKAFLVDGADDNAAEQSDLIEAFCREEGIRRLETVAGALLAETQRHLNKGRYNRALAALDLAEAVDPGRPQIHLARAEVYWESAGRNVAAVAELFKGITAAFANSIRDLSLFRRIALTLVVALAGTIFLFSLMMVWRYQVPFRHEVEEFVLRFADERLARPAGWIVLLAPFLVWVLIGWAALYWIAITFRFMRSSERLAATLLLLASVTALPIYRGSVAVYALAADPVVRTTLASADGEYDPDRIVRLRKLVDAHPEHASYRFLLGGLYKNGRFFEEAFEAYKQAIEIDPALEQAYINVGNIFAATGQYGEAIANYKQAIEIAPDSMLAHFNMHLVQSESFKFREAEETLRAARAIDAERVTELLSASSGERATVVDAQLEIGSVWIAALGGHGGTGLSAKSVAAGLANPIGIGSMAALFGCLALVFLTRGGEPARRCIRCGNPFCGYCKRSTEGHEYCTQCVHLFVLG